ncbi:MAG: hypothetical protein KC421_24020, partial [Anaerolineales bacterium]|nr:hypothetical protein [Anaerolineales bacterium]
PISLMVDGRWRQRAEYDNAELTWLTRADTRDTNESLVDNLTLLAKADYLAIMSDRVYGVVPGLPDKFPLSSQYHHLLFNGDLGYEPVFITGRQPELFGVSLYADTFDEVQPPARAAAFLDARPHLTMGRADESFTVYDHPLTIVFKNTGKMTAVEMHELFVP